MAPGKGSSSPSKVVCCKEHNGSKRRQWSLSGSEESRNTENGILWFGDFCVPLGLLINGALEKSKFTHENGQAFILINFLGNSSDVLNEKMQMKLPTDFRERRKDGLVLWWVVVVLIWRSLCAPTQLPKMLRLSLPDCCEKAKAVGVSGLPLCAVCLDRRVSYMPSIVSNWWS